MLINLLGSKVAHSTLGEGEISVQEDSQIFVKFSSKSMRFQYPLGFEQFIKLSDKKLQKSMDLEIEKFKVSKAEEQERERLRLLEIERIKVMEKEKKDAEEKPTTKKPKVPKDRGEPIDLSTLIIGNTYSNSEVANLFSCANIGGLRKSNSANALVTISNYTKSLYADKWHDNVLHYTGSGQIGDQELNRKQNKTLNQSRSNGVDIHLFEVFKKGNYVYNGIFELCGEPYQEKQEDDNGKLRNVWMFPLKLKKDNI